MTQPLTAITLGPADRLVIVYPADTDLTELDEAVHIIAERGWGDRVLVVAGVEQLAVLRGEAGEAADA